MTTLSHNPQNRVELRNQIIWISVIGNQNAKTVTHMGSEIDGLARQQRKDGAPVLIIDDIRQMGTTDSGARGMVAQLSKHLSFDRLAMLGSGNPVTRHGSNFILRAIGKASTMRYFEDESAALAWLAGTPD